MRKLLEAESSHCLLGEVWRFSCKETQPHRLKVHPNSMFLSALKKKSLSSICCARLLFQLLVLWAFPVSLLKAPLMSATASLSKVCLQNCWKTKPVLPFHFLAAVVYLSGLSRFRNPLVIGYQGNYLCCISLRVIPWIGKEEIAPEACCAHVLHGGFLARVRWVACIIQDAKVFTRKGSCRVL